MTARPPEMPAWRRRVARGARGDATPLAKSDSPAGGISSENQSISKVDDAAVDPEGRAVVEEPYDPSRPTFDLVTPRRKWEKIVERSIEAGRAEPSWESLPSPGLDYMW
jgi:hypothetical protein